MSNELFRLDHVLVTIWTDICKWIICVVMETE